MFLNDSVKYLSCVYYKYEIHLFLLTKITIGHSVYFLKRFTNFMTF